MNLTSKFLLGTVLVLFLFACSQRNRKAENESKITNATAVDVPLARTSPPPAQRPGTTFGTVANEAADGSFSYSVSVADASAASSSETGNGFVSSTAAVETGKDSTRKFVRTADLKFKVKNVIKATTAIEDITKSFGGFVTYTNLRSTIDYVNSTAVSADSSLETTYFTVANTLVLRVPNTELDTTLRTIATLIDFLDYRIINAEDVALQVLTNQLARNRMNKSEERLTKAIDTKGKKLGEITNSEEALLSKQEQADNAKIANLTLQDKIDFSTVNLSIYQRQTVKRELISNNKNIDAYQPAFVSRLIAAFKAGWNFFENIIVSLAHIWWLLLFAVILFILYRRFRTRG